MPTVDRIVRLYRTGMGAARSVSIRSIVARIVGDDVFAGYISGYIIRSSSLISPPESLE